MIKVSAAESCLQEYIYRLKYSRWIPELNRRETWPETVARFMGWLTNRFKDTPDITQWFPDIHSMILSKDIMPSMRLMASAGELVDSENLFAYNCKYQTIEKLEDFRDLFYSLLCGVGVGFSVETHIISKLPTPEALVIMAGNSELITMGDSRGAWAEALHKTIVAAFNGKPIDVDTSKTRPKGTPLVRTGGTASGGEIFKNTLVRVHHIISHAASWRRKLTSVEVYDICCLIAEVVKSGGVRRAACIALFSYNDKAMMEVKTPEALAGNEFRYNCNNSVVLPKEMTIVEFMKLFTQIKLNGEPGIVNRYVLEDIAEQLGRKLGDNSGVNPCGEIILRPHEFCNLTEVIVKPNDYICGKLPYKAGLAAVLGVCQSTLTDFNIIQATCAENCIDERLIGVSLTGIMDNVWLFSFDSEDEQGVYPFLEELKDAVVTMATIAADSLGINVPKAMTCVKPSGSVSKLCGSSSGIHPRFSKFYMTNVACPKDNSLCRFLKDQGVPVRYEDDNSVIFSFPQKAPEGAITAEGLSAKEQFAFWQIISNSYCHHNASCTIYVGKDEWDDIVKAAWEAKDMLAGISFFPKYENPIGSYSPIEKLTEEEYGAAAKAFPIVDWSKFPSYDSVNHVAALREISCHGGVCEL